MFVDGKNSGNDETLGNSSNWETLDQYFNTAWDNVAFEKCKSIEEN